MASVEETPARAREGKTHEHRSEVRDGMRIDWDVPIKMDDGLVLRADVFRPVQDGRYPVILSYGPYAKGLSMQEGYRHAWLRIVKAYPEIEKGSSNKYQNWELLDPERWVPDGYVLVRVDSRDSTGANCGAVSCGLRWHTPHDCTNSAWPSFWLSLSGDSWADALAAARTTTAAIATPG